MNLTARPYADDADRDRIFELRRACTTPANVIDFPALVDLGELFAPGETTPHHTRLWFEADDHLIA